MKGRFRKGLALMLLQTVLLTACGGKETWIAGLVTQVQTGEEGEITAIVLLTDSGEVVGVLLTDKTVTFLQGSGSGTKEELRAAFQEEVRLDKRLHVSSTGRKKNLAVGDGEKIPAYEADDIYIAGQLDRAAVTLKDGTPVDVMEDEGRRTYRLSDGTELLQAQDPGSYVTGLELLNEEAQIHVLDYYQKRGLLYDETEELEKVYALYREPGQDFAPGLVEQTTAPSAASWDVVYFETVLTLPAGEENGNLLKQIRLGDAFDRVTGKRLDPWEMFAVPKGEVIRSLLDASGIREQEFRDKLEAADWDGRIVFTPGGLSVMFEAESLPGQGDSVGFSVEYEEVQGLLRNWAVPADGGWGGI